MEMRWKSNVSQNLLIHKHDLLYTPNHTWARIINDRTAKVGLSKYVFKYIKKFSGSTLGIAFVQTEPIGAEVKRMQPFGVAETMMTTFDLVSPVSGRIKKVNTAAKVLDEDYILNNNPEETWIVEIEPTHLEEETGLLLTIDQYKKSVSAGKNL